MTGYKDALLCIVDQDRSRAVKHRVTGTEPKCDLANSVWLTGKGFCFYDRRLVIIQFRNGWQLLYRRWSGERLPTD